MQMHPRAALAKLSVGLGKLASLFQVQFRRLLAVVSSKIEIDDNMILWNPYVVKSLGIDILERGPNIIPSLLRSLLLRRVLCRAI